MSCSMISSGDVGRQALDHLDDHAGLARRHAGRRLVEQQHLGREAERHRDLDQALAAIGELADRPQRVVGEAEPLEQREGFLDRGAVMPGGAEQAAGDPLPLARPRGSRFRARSGRGTAR